jgi:hypothetical protein
MASMASGFRNGKVMAGKLIASSTKEFAIYFARPTMLEASQPISTWRNQQLRVNALTQPGRKKTRYPRRFVTTRGIVLGLRCKTQHVPRKSWRCSRPLVSVSASIVSFGERRISQQGFAQGEQGSQALRHKGKTDP